MPAASCASCPRPLDSPRRPALTRMFGCRIRTRRQDPLAQRRSTHDGNDVSEGAPPASSAAGPEHGHLARWPAATPAPGSSWATYGADLASTRYSPARSDQRDELQQARGRVAVQDRQPRPAPGVQPSVHAARWSNGVLYSTAGTRRAVVALDAGDRRDDVGVQRRRGQARRKPRRGSSRAAALPTGPTAREERIVYVTPGYRLIALDAKTGRPIPSFGKDGDRRSEASTTIRQIDLDHRRHRAARRAAHRQRRRRRRRGASAGRRAQELQERQGLRARLRRAHRQAALDLPHHPAPGEFGNDTWLKDSWAYTGNTGVWAQMSADEELGHRVPAGRRCRPATTTAATGPAPTCSARASSRSTSRPASACGTTSSFITTSGTGTFRARRSSPTSRVERPDDQSGRAADQAGLGLRLRSHERAAGLADRRAARAAGRRARASGIRRRSRSRPSRRRSTVRACRSTILIDFTPELRAEAVEARRRTTSSGRSSRRRSSASGKARVATLMLPTATGGANWQGGSLDPETNAFYIFTNSQVGGARSAAGRSGAHRHALRGRTAARSPTRLLEARAPVLPGRRRPRARRRTGAAAGGGEAPPAQLTVQGLPLVKPPYGRITRDRSEQGRDGLADRARRDAGQRPQPSGAEGRDHPAHRTAGTHRHARHEDARDRGRRRVLHDAERAARRDAPRVRQGDREGGRRGVHAGPADRLADDLSCSNGQQYLVVAISGRAYSGELLAFKLPPEAPPAAGAPPAAAR